MEQQRKMCEVCVRGGAGEGGTGGLGVKFTLSAAPSAKFGNALGDVPRNSSGMHKARSPMSVCVCVCVCV